MVLVMILRELSVVKDVCPSNVELGMSLAAPPLVWSSVVLSWAGLGLLAAVGAGDCQ